MFSRARTFLIGGVGAAAVVLGAAAPGVAAGTPGPGDDTLPHAIETLDYPGAAKIYKERGIKLGRGDGHLILGDCKTVSDIVVFTDKQDGPDQGKHCFKVTGSGKTARLTLRIEGVTAVSAGRYDIKAVVNDFPGLYEVPSGLTKHFDKPLALEWLKV
ncbi:hypothetical protein [Streptomyces telluris]|uniref:Secreted protein n=1 Tax=Streptomyces telluris TaxID=2720021 RepID=A0A9X2LLH8_9ACTN|nr:hypothetical protein [Streptomyces telluris]MCQ8773447.1 hypothetical protein [Streptomyces telluris]NJP78244.1 hypothetical protein [Streptomyces telluris]